MIRVVVDAALRSKLLDMAQPVELCDESGRVLGRVLPEVNIADWEPVAPDLSEEELQRRENESESLSTEEMLAHLESLGCSESAGRGPQ